MKRWLPRLYVVAVCVPGFDDDDFDGFALVFEWGAIVLEGTVARRRQVAP